MSFPAYDTYKDSGNELLGNIPFSWDVWKLAHAFTQIGSGTTPKSDKSEYYDEGTIPWVNTGDLDDGPLVDCAKKITEKAVEDHSTLKLYPAGSLLFAMYGATIGKLGLLEFPATVNQACCVFSGESPIDKKFLFYWFLGLRQRILSLATGGGQPNVSQDILRTLRVACPDIDEQKAISSFLDVETSKIDGLVSEQRRLIELLKEKRQAVISHAVTKGLNPNAPMKPSGIQWLGDVPQHWKILPVQRLAKDGNKTFTDGDWIERPYVTDSGVRLLQTGNVGIGHFKEQGFRYISDETFDELNCTELKPRDVLVCRLDGPVGRACLAPDLGVRMITSVDNAILKVKDDIHPDFVVDVFTSKQWLSWIEAICRVGGGFRLRISRTMLGLQRIPVPPYEEQIEIAESIDREQAVTDTLAAEAERAIELLQERRTALISAAVTGKIDVRGFSKSGVVT